jgi:hypothetical protein
MFTRALDKMESSLQLTLLALPLWLFMLDITHHALLLSDTTLCTLRSILPPLPGPLLLLLMPQLLLLVTLK